MTDEEKIEAARELLRHHGYTEKEIDRILGHTAIVKQLEADNAD